MINKKILIILILILIIITIYLFSNNKRVEHFDKVLSYSRPLLKHDTDIANNSIETTSLPSLPLINNLTYQNYQAKSTNPASRFVPVKDLLEDYYLDNLTKYDSYIIPKIQENQSKMINELAISNPAIKLASLDFNDLNPEEYKAKAIQNGSIIY